MDKLIAIMGAIDVMRTTEKDRHKKIDRQTISKICQNKWIDLLDVTWTLNNMSILQNGQRWIVPAHMYVYNRNWIETPGLNELYDLVMTLKIM